MFKEINNEVNTVKLQEWLDSKYPIPECEPLINKMQRKRKYKPKSVIKQIHIKK